MKQLEKQQTLNAAVTAARAAGAVMLRNLHGPKKINLETPHDIKLELDVRCQKLIEQSLHRVFPEISLLGEEGKSGAADAARRWVVDPIDGTVNYAHGIPHACVSIALQERDDRGDYITQSGVVFDPFTNELWTASRGGVARLNGRVIRVSQRHRLDQAMVAIGFSKTKSNLAVSLPYFSRLARRVRKVRIMGSAALALTYVASGRLDAYIERRISLWDIAAGGLIVECAGGKFQIEPVSGYHRYRMLCSNGSKSFRLTLPR